MTAQQALRNAAARGARRPPPPGVVLTKDDLRKGVDVAGFAWRIVEKGRHGGKYGALRELKDGLLARRRDPEGPQYTSKEAARLMMAMATGKVVDGEFNKLMADRILTLKHDMRSMCMLAAAYEKMRVSDATLLDRLRKFTFDPHRGKANAHTPKNQPLRHGFAKIEDQVYIAAKLSICGYHAALEDLFTFAQRKRGTVNAAKWTQHIDARTMAMLLHQCGNLRRMPGKLSRHCFERILAIQGAQPPAPPPRGQQEGIGTIFDKRAEVVVGEKAEVPKHSRFIPCSRFYAKYAKGFAFIPEAEEFRAVAVPMMVTQGMAQPGKVSDEDLVLMLYCLGQAKVGLDAAPEAFDELIQRVDNVADWPFPNVYRAIFAIAACAQHNFDERVSVPAKLASVLDVCLEHATSVESGEAIRTGELARMFWSLAKLRVENQYQIQGLASCVREHPHLAELLSAGQAETILLAMSKLRMWGDLDIFQDILKRLFETFDSSAATAPVHVSNAFKAVGCFAQQFSPRVREAVAKKLVGFLSKIDFRYTQSGMVSRTLWGLARLEYCPSGYVTARLHELLDEHAGTLKDYEMFEVKEWQAFFAKAASQAHAQGGAIREEPAPARDIDSHPTAAPLPKGFSKPHQYDVPTLDS
eukprot:TRINITY_DN29681_c0_g1_i1.p1 TRINITY_DN29681_c0_g1~~TRINITY_DN29681_c0_g1_i1.p1  ORF type:complete len:640 (+),score=189.85 TRINITY_DN29681_c0_g1_i1:84-2003(+)